MSWARKILRDHGYFAPAGGVNSYPHEQTSTLTLGTETLERVRPQGAQQQQAALSQLMLKYI